MQEPLPPNKLGGLRGGLRRSISALPRARWLAGLAGAALLIRDGALEVVKQAHRPGDRMKILATRMEF
jgi:hypothetical protein